MNGETLLSKWWTTESCREAYERANRQKAERIQKLKETLNAKRETLKREVEQWEEVTG